MFNKLFYFVLLNVQVKCVTKQSNHICRAHYLNKKAVQKCIFPYVWKLMTHPTLPLNCFLLKDLNNKDLYYQLVNIVFRIKIDLGDLRLSCDFVNFCHHL